MKNTIDELGKNILNSHNEATVPEKRRAVAKRRKPKGVKVTVEVSQAELTRTDLAISPAFRVHIGAAMREHVLELCNSEWLRRQYVVFLRNIEEQRRADFELKMQALSPHHKSRRPRAEPSPVTVQREVPIEPPNQTDQAAESLESKKADVCTIQPKKP